MTDSLSPRLPRGRLLRSTLFIATGTVAVVALAGCGSGSTSESNPTATSATSATSTPSATATATADATQPEATATPTPAPTAAGVSVAFSCDQVLTLDDIYAFNPSYGTAPAFKPTQATGQTAAEFEGLNCGLLNQSSDGMIEVSVTQPNEALMTQLKNEAVSSSQIVPTYGTPPEVEGYFSAADGTGVAQVFTATYWITVGSTEFFEPGDAQALVSAAITNLQ